jgi:hypothetical protein
MMLGFNTMIELSSATFLIDNNALRRSVPFLPILSPVRMSSLTLWSRF